MLSMRLPARLFASRPHSDPRRITSEHSAGRKLRPGGRHDASATDRRKRQSGRPEREIPHGPQSRPLPSIEVIYKIDDNYNSLT